MDFWVVGKRVMIADGEKEQPGAIPTPRRSECHTFTAISCPPRSLTGLGSELMIATPGIGTLMELETKSSGGLLRALSGALVWRTANDFTRLAMEVARTKFADGRLVWEVLPQLTVAPGEPIAQMIEARGNLKKLTNHMLTDIRDYVKRLVQAAERNELPLRLLRHLLSFLGSPPGGATGPQPAPRHPPTAVWRTMTRLKKLRLDSGLGGHARKRHHTSECAEVPTLGTVHRPPRRRHLTAPSDPCGALVSCEELQPLPGGAEHPLDLHMADRTVRFSCRPAAAIWEGSEFSLRWRRELATQLRCRIVGRVTLFSHTRHHLRKETSQRCLKHDVKRLLWKRAQQQRKLLREHQQQQQQQQKPEPEEEKPQQLPHPYPQGSRVLKFLGISPRPYTFGNNMLVFPPPLKESRRSNQRQQKLKFEPSQRSSFRQEKQSQSPRRQQLQGQQPGPQHDDQTTTAQVHHPNMDEKQQSPAVSASKSNQQKIEHRHSSAQQAIGSSGSQRGHRQSARQAAAGAVSGERDPSGGHRLPSPSLEDYRFALLQEHFSVILQGRRRRQNVDKPLPPRSPLAGPAPPAEPPEQPAASARQQLFRPGLWLRLMAPVAGYVQGIPSSPPQIKQRRSSPPQVQKTYPSLPQAKKEGPFSSQTQGNSPRTQKTEPSPSQAQKKRLPPQQTQREGPSASQTQRAEPSLSQVQMKRPSPPQIQVTRPSPFKTQGKRPSPPQTQRARPSPPQTPGARSTPSQTRRQPSRSPGTPSPSLWDRMTDRLGLARSQTPPGTVELGQEATEARVRAIVQYQSTLPPLLRVRLLEGGC